jgi:hypothetical protein
MALITEDTLANPYAANDYLIYEAVFFEISSVIIKALTDRLATKQVQIPVALFDGLSPFKSSDYATAISVVLAAGECFDWSVSLLNKTRVTCDSTSSHEIDVSTFRLSTAHLNTVCRKPIVDISLAVKLTREIFDLLRLSANNLGAQAGIIPPPVVEQDPPEMVVSSKPSIFGLLHAYRQHFFYTEIKAGPIEIVQALAPNEKMEVVIEESRLRSFERLSENENEFNSSASSETKDSTELSESVSNSFSRNSTSTVSAEANFGASIGWGGGASATSTVSETSSNAAEKTSRTLAEITKRQSESIKKRTKISTRSFEQTSNRSSTRHVIENKGPDAINYGLRRLYYDVRCKLEDRGPRLVLQTSVESPGKQLATSDLVDKREVENPTVSGKKIQKRVTVNAVASTFFNDSTKIWEVNLDTFVFAGMAEPEKQEAMKSLVCTQLDRWIVPVFNPAGRQRDLDGIARAEFNIPNPVVNPYLVQHLVVHGTKEGYGRGVVTFCDFAFDFSFNESVLLPQAVLDALARNRVGAAERVLAIQSIGRNKRDRTIDGLQAEEVASLTSNALAKLFPSMYVALGVEMIPLIARVLDLSAVFFRLAEPCWSEFAKKNPERSELQYLIHSEASAAKGLGASLEWKHQIDGDIARDLFLNAVSATVCLPVRPGMEPELVALVNQYDIQKPISFDAGMKSMLRQIAFINQARLEVSKRNLNESDTAVTVSTKIDEDPRKWLEELINSGQTEIPKDLTWRQVYPLISQQNVSIPVQGYVHEKIEFEVLDGSKNWRDSGKSLSATKTAEFEAKRPWYCRLF